jgi:hypothetical protein
MKTDTKKAITKMVSKKNVEKIKLARSPESNVLAIKSYNHKVITTQKLKPARGPKTETPSLELQF